MENSSIAYRSSYGILDSFFFIGMNKTHVGIFLVAYIFIIQDKSLYVDFERLVEELRSSGWFKEKFIEIPSQLNEVTKA